MGEMFMLKGATYLKRMGRGRLNLYACTYTVPRYSILFSGSLTPLKIWYISYLLMCGVILTPLSFRDVSSQFVLFIQEYLFNIQTWQHYICLNQCDLIRASVLHFSHFLLKKSHPVSFTSQTNFNNQNFKFSVLLIRTKIRDLWLLYSR